MADVFRSEGPGQSVVRAIEGLSLFGIGTYRQVYVVPLPSPYQDGPATWGGSPAESRPLSFAVLANCLGETSAASEAPRNGAAWDLHEQFAEDVICRLDSASPLALEWNVAQSWIDQHTLGELGAATRCIQRIREFERLLDAALDKGDASRSRFVNADLWRQWDAETLVSLCIAAKDPQPELLVRFVDHLLDLKFKLYCLLEVDVPAYAAAIRKWGLQPDDLGSTPQGFVTRLSEEVTLVIKSRAIWESVMNAVYWYATGRDAPTVKVTDEWGVTFRSKTDKFFPWVADEPSWSSLGTFKPLVEALDHLRMSEVHRLSRVRADFTNLVLRPIDRCVELLNCILRYVFDHLVTVIALRDVASYDASAGSNITVGVTV